MEKLYCICDLTDPQNSPEVHLPVDGLSDLTYQAAENWILENQTEDNKYCIMRHNDIEEIE